VGFSSRSRHRHSLSTTKRSGPRKPFDWNWADWIAASFVTSFIIIFFDNIIIVLTSSIAGNSAIESFDIASSAYFTNTLIIVLINYSFNPDSSG
jgi:hypothetical protein